MKKYLILALSAVLVIIAVLWGYAAFNGLYGTWINVNPQPGNIFDGNVKIEKIKMQVKKTIKIFVPRKLWLLMKKSVKKD